MPFVKLSIEKMFEINLFYLHRWSKHDRKWGYQRAVSHKCMASGQLRSGSKGTTQNNEQQQTIVGTQVARSCTLEYREY